jgi:hypothetical protein
MSSRTGPSACDPRSSRPGSPAPSHAGEDVRRSGLGARIVRASSDGSGW